MTNSDYISIISAIIALLSMAATIYFSFKASAASKESLKNAEKSNNIAYFRNNLPTDPKKYLK